MASKRHAPEMKAEASAQAAPLAQIPVELTLMIYECLSPPCRIRLALTAKRMFAIFCGVFSEIALRRLEPEDKLSLLHSLEKDHPRLVYCAGCHLLRKMQYDDAKLSSELWNDTFNHANCSGQFTGVRVSWKHQWTWWPLPSYTKEKTLDRVGCDVWALGRSGVKISFAEAHAVMHRHLHGKPYGLPVDGLKRFFSSEEWYPARNPFHPWLSKHRDEHRSEQLIPWSMEHDVDAAVIEGELFLRQVHHVSCTAPADANIPFRELEQLQLPVCNHISMYSEDRVCVDGKWVIRYDAHHKRSDNAVAPEIFCLSTETVIRHKSLRSCVYCYTDYRLSIDWGYDGQRNVELSTYHRLGPCRTVNERAWQALCMKYPDSIDGLKRIEDAKDWGLGEIHIRWHQHHQESLKEWNNVALHWADYHYDARYNPWVQAKYGVEERPKKYLLPVSKDEASWFCECNHHCLEFPDYYGLYHHPQPRLLWSECIENADSIMRADPQDTIQQRTRDLLYLPMWETRPYFTDEENVDKFGRELAG